MNPYPISPIQIISIVFSIFLLGVIFSLIRKKKLREEYAILWVLVSLLFLVLSVFRGLIDAVSKLMGIKYQPASLFLILFGCLFLLAFHFSLVISDLKKKLNTMAKSVALLQQGMAEKKRDL